MKQTQHDSEHEIVEKNLNGEYQFDLNLILKEGFKNTLKHFFPFLQMMIILMGIAFLIFFLFIKIEGIQTEEDLTQTKILSFQLIIQIFLAPFLAAFMLQGVKANLQSKLKVGELFEQIPRFLPIVIISIFVALLTGLGMSLYVLPGLYIYMATGFAILLTVDKKMTPLQSLMLSVRMVNRYLPKFILLYVIFTVLMILSIMTYGLGFLVLFPFYHIVKGALYRDLFGYAKMPSSNQIDNQDESTFEA
ncbi:hypothetical protein [Aliiglaciecola litoralis]|uniref:Membrane protein n=1 Tax=Aliiglaciecola litoralis TaxID=582857 RepID=A0ABN1LCC3_9ALTE